MGKLNLYWTFYLLIVVVGLNFQNIVNSTMPKLELTQMELEQIGFIGDQKPSITYANPNDDPLIEERAGRELANRIFKKSKSVKKIVQYHAKYRERTFFWRRMLILLATVNAFYFYIINKNHFELIFGSSFTLIMSIFFLF